MNKKIYEYYSISQTSKLFKAVHKNNVYILTNTSKVIHKAALLINEQFIFWKVAGENSINFDLYTYLQCVLHINK